MKLRRVTQLRSKRQAVHSVVAVSVGRCTRPQRQRDRRAVSEKIHGSTSDRSRELHVRQQRVRHHVIPAQFSHPLQRPDAPRLRRQVDISRRKNLRGHRLWQHRQRW